MSHKELERTITIVRQLRDPVNGCPWDLDQTHESLYPYAIEEAYELKDAILRDNSDDIKSELGDVLLQVLLHSVIAEERETFNLEDVAKNLGDKMIRRHPHVFQTKEKLNKDEIIANWKEIKRIENLQIKESPISNKNLHHPSLVAAHLIGVASKNVSFDWQSSQEVWLKVKEELQELEEVFEKNVPEKVEEELGDLLFSLAQFSRHLGLEAENVLEKANKKFMKRFRYMEQIIEKEGKVISNLSSIEMDKYWNLAKKGTSRD